jgi:hypothetical protein
MPKYALVKYSMEKDYVANHRKRGKSLSSERLQLFPNPEENYQARRLWQSFNNSMPTMAQDSTQHPEIV